MLFQLHLLVYLLMIANAMGNKTPTALSYNCLIVDNHISGAENLNKQSIWKFRNRLTLTQELGRI